MTTTKKQFKAFTGEDPEDVLGGDWRQECDAFDDGDDKKCPECGSHETWIDTESDEDENGTVVEGREFFTCADCGYSYELKF